MADCIVHNARITTMDPANPQATAVAVADGRFACVGTDAEAMALVRPGTLLIDANGRRMVPGLIDSHIHVIRGGLNFNLELRWDGVPSLADAMALLRAQVARTPAPQWVRVVGGFSERQFAEKRLPTLAELNAVAPDTPVFILHLYDRALLNAAALRAVGYDRTTPDPPGGEIERDRAGHPTGLILARPNALILYATLARGPKLPVEYQANSTRHFMRELNRLGVTSAIDAGGGFQNYPEDYSVIGQLAREGALTLRIAYNLFTQNKGAELQDFARWTGMVSPGQGDATFRHNGAGEMLVFSAADFEDFREPRPDMPAGMESDLDAVVRLLAGARWPFRLHATYDETIGRALDVFERVHRDIPIDRLHWFFDHAETISPRNIERIRALGGGVAVQHRMAFQGEYFLERYGEAATRRSPPIRRMLEMGVPVGGGTDATRVASYNPWVALHWLVSGQTVGGTRIYDAGNRLDRHAALERYTAANAWFSSEEGEKGRIRAGELADFAVLSADYFAVAEDDIPTLTSVLTVLGGRVVHGDDEFRDLAPDLPPAMPDWVPPRWAGPATGPAIARTRTGALRMPTGACSAHAPSGNWLSGACPCWAF